MTWDISRPCKQTTQTEEAKARVETREQNFFVAFVVSYKDVLGRALKMKVAG